MVCTVVAQQEGGVGKTTTAINVAVLLSHHGKRVLVIDTDPQFALTRQLGIEVRSLAVNLVDVPRRARARARRDRHRRARRRRDPGGRELAGAEMSLVGEIDRERFLHDALEPVLDRYDEVVIDTPPNLGLLSVNALVCADRVLAPVSAEDEASLHGILELRVTVAKLAARLGTLAPEIIAVLTRWHPSRVSSRNIEDRLAVCGLAPVARICLRSAAVAHAAATRVPLALSAPDSSVALAYRRLVEQLAQVGVR